MKAVQWVSNRRKLMRWLLGLPLLWRIAYRLVTKNLSHDENGTACLVCVALKRKERYKHVATMNAARQLFCKKCGLPLLQWRGTACKGNGPKMPDEPIDDWPVKIIPINWD